MISRAPAADRGRHRRPLRDPLVSRAGQAGALAPRLQRDRHAPAPGGVRAHAHARAGRRAWLGCDLRLRGRGAPVLHGGAGRRDAAPHPLSARRLRARGRTSRTSRAAIPQIACCMLRFQPEIGADLDAPLVRYLSLPVVPTQLGYDPRLQLLDADDATGRARGRGVERRPRPGQHRAVGRAFAEPDPPHGRPAVDPDPASAVRAGARAARRQARRRPAASATPSACFASAGASTTVACAESSASSRGSTRSRQPAS